LSSEAYRNHCSPLPTRLAMIVHQTALAVKSEGTLPIGDGLLSEMEISE
jgi:hypothetical protein